MPPLTKQHSVKSSARTTCTAFHALITGSLLITYPWARNKREPINVNDPNLPDFTLDGWDKEKARHNNAFLGINIMPTRSVNAGSLSRLGLHEDMHATLHAQGIADLCYEAHSL
ncbi:hypothetical protein N665_0532s0080 [Sinapis alba]|nr:hypothetical protein N665_0532s0080 [Sinapis alba]